MKAYGIYERGEGQNWLVERAGGFETITDADRFLDNDPQMRRDDRYFAAAIDDA